MNTVANGAIGKVAEQQHAASPAAVPATRALRATRVLPAASAAAAAQSPASGGNHAAGLESPEQAYARGLAEGEARAQQQLRQQVEALEVRTRRERDALAAHESALAAATAGIDALARDYAAACEGMLARLTLLACTRVTVALASEDRLIAQAVQATLAEFADEPAMELLLHRDDLARLPQAMLAAARVPLLPADDIARGCYRLRTPHRRLDVDIAQQFRRLCAALLGDGHDAG